MAGHIDHGKTALVRALTGYDPDRLKEEKERGMTTDLGFAFYGDTATIIDVPGHERFVRHMIAGATTIDLVLLVIAANEGIKPQTIEHFSIIKLLGLKHGIIVITKKDTVEEDILKILEEDVKNLIRGSDFSTAPCVFCSAVTGEGIEELKTVLKEVMAKIPPREDRGVFRMPIDRSFKIKGFGSVVAGTVLSGIGRIGETMEVLPQRCLVRIRGIEKHKRRFDFARIGERAAFNLLGGEKEEIKRGDVLACPNAYQPTRFFNAYLSALPENPFPIKKRMDLKLHIGTKETKAKIILLDRDSLLPGDSGYAQIIADEELVTEYGDRFVLRSFGPLLTIGGGKVLEVIKERQSKITLAERLKSWQVLNSEDKKEVVAEIIRMAGFYPISFQEIGKRVGLNNLKRILTCLKEENKIIELGEDEFISTDSYHKAKDKIVGVIKDFHSGNPYRAGIKGAELKSKLEKEMAKKLIESLLNKLTAKKDIILDKEIYKLPGFTILVSEAEKHLLVKITETIKEKGFLPPDLADLNKIFPKEKRIPELVGVLKERGEVIEIGGFFFHKEILAKAKEKLLSLFQKKPEITASEFRQVLNTTRRYVIPLLNYFDSQGVTERRGDFRVLRK